MTLELPHLSAGDLRERLNEIFRTNHRGHLVAFQGTGERGTVDTDVGVFDVLPVASELALRTELPGIDVEDARIAFLVPFAGTLPIDIGGRFAQGGRIFLLGRAARLRTLFKASEVDADAATGELARTLVAGHGRESYAFGGGRLTRDALWSAWLAEELGIPTDGGLSLEGLLAWSMTDARGPAWTAKMSAANADALRGELVSVLTARVGIAAAAVFRAWSCGQGRALVELAVLVEALASSTDGAVRMWTTMKAEASLAVGKGEEAGPIAEALGKVASATLRRLERVEGADALRRSVLASADARIDRDEVRRAVAASRWLPSAWTAGLARLGAVLRGGVEASSQAAITEATALLADLERHALFKDAAHARVFESAEMAVRLLAWLATRGDEARPREATSYAEVERLAQWYADEGGFVDWARRRARGAGDGPFGAGVEAVIAAVDAVRAAQDRAFSRALPAWLESGKPAQRVLPIERAVLRLAAGFLEERPDRRLLVLLMDGMAWTQAAQIATSLTAWAPIAWQGAGRPRGLFFPVLAALPTITEVSRSAFFGGEALPAGRDGDAQKDADLWARNTSVKPFAKKGEDPRLLLRAEGHTPGGAASKEALSLVRDEKHRVVALVINAIDSSLKGDSQTDHRWTAESIKSLPALLEAAREAGRTVLLASDHGHVPADRLAGVGTPAAAKARWRPWTSTDEALADYEVAIPKSVAWAPAGAEGIVLLADENHRYGGAPHAGEHGGASLAEVVAPAMLIDCERLTDAGERDAALELQPLAPPWWTFDLRAAKPVTPRARRSSSSKLRAVARPPPALAASLATSELFVSRGLAEAKRAKVLDAVGYLAERDGFHASAKAFAAAMGILPGRVGGLVSALTETLNRDGYQVVRYDTVADIVQLDLDKLKLLFSLP